MKINRNLLTYRVRRAAMRSVCRYKVVAIGIDHRGRIIDIVTNSHRLRSRSYHAEERLIHRNPPSLRRIMIARVGATGEFLPIDACRHCRNIAEKRGIEIRRYEP